MLNPTADDLLSMSSGDNHDLLLQDLMNLGIHDSTPSRNQPQLSVQKYVTPSNCDFLGDLLSSSPEKPGWFSFQFLESSIRLGTQF